MTEHTPSEEEQAIIEAQMNTPASEGGLGLRVEEWKDGETVIGERQIDERGREVLRSDTEGRIVQTEWREGRDQQAGQEWKQEHPNGEYQLDFQGFGAMPAKLMTLGETTKGSPDGTNVPWAHFEVNDPTALQAFEAAPPSQRKPNSTGTYAQLNSDFGSMTVDVGGRIIQMDKIGRISVDYDPEGKPIKATIHKILWQDVTGLAQPTSSAESSAE